MAYFSLLEKVELKEATQKMEAFSLLTKRVHPLALGGVNRVLNQTQLVADQLLNPDSPDRLRFH